MFNNISSFCIRNNKLNPILSKDAIITNSIANIHKKLLSFCFDKGHERALIFENQLLLSDTTLLDFDEIQRFIDENTDWDILIIGECPLIKNLVKGYNKIYHSSSRTKFISNAPYIASKRFMTKIKHNNRSSINTYIYNPCLCNTFMEIDDPKTITGYTIGMINDMNVNIDSKEIHYEWKSIKISE